MYLSVVSSWFMHAVHVVEFPSILKANYYSTVSTYHILFLHACVDGHLGCFLAIVYNAAVNMGVLISL